MGLLFNSIVVYLLVLLWVIVCLREGLTLMPILHYTDLMASDSQRSVVE